MSPSPDLPAAPAPWWSAALRQEIEALYRDLEAEIRAAGVACWQRGDCCDFERSDHLLYASTLEIAHVQELHPRPFSPGSKLCPFWIDGLCTLRERRPLGCRTYFCDRRFQEKLHALYEKYHRRIKVLAARHRAPWVYLPFVDALRTPPLSFSLTTSPFHP
ncbi:MAG: hypothetical protein HY717_06460 [Planctomycetes bacterium]|nr:hypothetical protein [Planctomycetota bacterium]